MAGIIQLIIYIFGGIKIHAKMYGEFEAFPLYDNAVFGVGVLFHDPYINPRVGLHTIIIPIYREFSCH